MKKFASFIDRFAVLLLIAAFAVTLGMLPGIKRIKLANGLGDSALPENKLTKSASDVKNTFGENSNQIVISIEANKDDLKIVDFRSIELIEKLTNQLKNSGVLNRQSVLSLTTAKNFTSDQNGIEAKKIFSEIPKSETDVLALETKLKNDPFYYGRLVSKDFKSTLIIAQAYENKSMTDVHNVLTKILDTLKSQYPEIKLILLGDPEITYQLDSNATSDSVMFAGLSLALIFLSFFLVFKSWRGVILPLLSMTMVIIWTMGAVGYWGEKITVIATTIPVLLVVGGVEYILHIYDHLFQASKKGLHFKHSFLDTLTSSVSPLSVACLTNFIGQLSLITFAIRPIQHFGVFTAIGSLFTFIISFIVLPSFYKVFHKPVEKMETLVENSIVNTKNLTNAFVHFVPVVGTVSDSLSVGVRSGWKGFKTEIKKTDYFELMTTKLGKFIYKYPYPIVIGTLLIMTYSVYRSQEIQIGYDNVSLLPKVSEIRTGVKHIDEAFGGTQNFEIMIDAKKVGGILNPDFIAKADQFQTESLKIKGISHGFSVMNIFKKVHSLLSPNDKYELPKKSDLISQYLFLVSMSDTGVPMTSLVSADNQKIKIQLTAHSHDTKELSVIHDELDTLGTKIFGDLADVKVGGQIVNSIAIVRYLVVGKFQNIISSILMLFLMFAIIYRSIARSMYSIVPIFIQISLNFGLMAIAGIRLDFITAIITSFAMGLGTDFGIHSIAGLKESYHKEGNMKAAIMTSIRGPGRLIAYTAVCNIVGFSALFISNFKAIQTFAILMNFNMITLFIAATVVVPALIVIIPPEFITQERARAGKKQSGYALGLKIAFSSAFVIALSVVTYMLELKL